MTLRPWSHGPIGLCVGLALLVMLSACGGRAGAHPDRDAGPDAGGCAGSQSTATWFPDRDGDGFGSALVPGVVACTPLTNHSPLATDCDDTDSSVNPGNAELCDGIDNDCKGGIDDALFCGVCMCALANAEQVDCFAGPDACTIGTCDRGFLDCDDEHDNGCEASREDVATCGYCGNVCDPRASCVFGAGIFDCECQAGLSGDGTTCEDCSAGYYGTDSVCGPVLTGLTLSSGALTPALSNDVTAYTAHVSLATQTLTLTPTASPEATITINGVVIASGSPWQSSVLDFGDTTIEIVVTQHERPTRSYTLVVDRNATQTAYVKASPNIGGYFGGSVAISGNTIVVGDPYESSAASGVNGDPRLGPGTYYIGGAAYVFVRNGGVWSQEAFLKPATPSRYARFGSSVAISANTIVIGTPGERSNGTVDGDPAGVGAGAAYVFVRNGGIWSQQAYLEASNTEEQDAFGVSVAVSDDTVAVGAIGESSGATGVDGNQDDNSVYGSGAVYVFARNGSSWSQQAYLKVSVNESFDRYPYDSNAFGASLSLSGRTLVVGAPGECSNAIGVNGDPTDHSALGSGAAYVFTRDVGTWSQQAYFKASNAGPGDQFGAAVAIDGEALVVAAPYEASRSSGVDGNQTNNQAESRGAAYVFERDGDSWTQRAYLKPRPAIDYTFGSTSGEYGKSVAISANRVVVTGYRRVYTPSPGYDYGAADVFVRSGSSWSPGPYLAPTYLDADDIFGASVAISDDMIVIGSPREDSDAEGINGDQTDNSLESGAVYVFE